MMRRQMLMMAVACVLACVPSACGWDVARKGALGDKPSPPEYKVKLETTKGDVIILVHRDWAPIGADHFYALVTKGYYDNNAFFRAIKGFVVQFGMNGDPKTTGKYSKPIKDDPPKVPNKTGSVVFAQTSSPNSRSTHIFINIGDNSANLDPMNFTPFGEVILGLDNVMNLYMDYGDAPPDGTGPDQAALAEGGNAYLKAKFPNLDYIKKASIIDPAPAPAASHVVHKPAPKQ